MARLFVLLLMLLTFAFSREVPFTQEDRDRLIRVEERVIALEKRIDTLQTIILWGFGILFGGMGILIGFVIWDRRTAVEPVQKKVRELERKEETMERILKDFAKKNEELREIMRREGLL